MAFFSFLGSAERGLRLLGYGVDFSNEVMWVAYWGDPQDVKLGRFANYHEAVGALQSLGAPPPVQGSSLDVLGAAMFRDCMDRPVFANSDLAQLNPNEWKELRRILQIRGGTVNNIQGPVTGNALQVGHIGGALHIGEPGYPPPSPPQSWGGR